MTARVWLIKLSRVVDSMEAIIPGNYSLSKTSENALGDLNDVLLLSVSSPNSIPVVSPSLSASELSSVPVRAASAAARFSARRATLFRVLDEPAVNDLTEATLGTDAVWESGLQPVAVLFLSRPGVRIGSGALALLRQASGGGGCSVSFGPSLRGGARAATGTERLEVLWSRGAER